MGCHLRLLRSNDPNQTSFKLFTYSSTVFLQPQYSLMLQESQCCRGQQWKCKYNHTLYKLDSLPFSFVSGLGQTVLRTFYILHYTSEKLRKFKQSSFIANTLQFDLKKNIFKELKALNNKLIVFQGYLVENSGHLYQSKVIVA